MRKRTKPSGTSQLRNRMASTMTIRNSAKALALVGALLTLGAATPTDTPVAEAARIVREVDPPRLASVDTGFRGDLDTIVTKAMEKDPDDRYQSAGEMAEHLDQYISG